MFKKKNLKEKKKLKQIFLTLLLKLNFYDPIKANTLLESTIQKKLLLDAAYSSHVRVAVQEIAEVTQFLGLSYDHK